MRKLEAVFFDLDGTLVNTITDLANAYNYALEKLSLPKQNEADYKYFVGDGSLNCAIRASNNSELAHEVHRIALEYYDEHLIDYSEPYTGVYDAIEVLLNRGIKMAVLSNKPDFATKKIINTLFPKGTFVLVQGKEDTMKLKPNPSHLLSMCEEMDVDPRNCVFVGDTNVDMKTANNANMIAVGVEWGFRTIEELEQHGADVILEEPAEISSLPEIFETLDD
ncbi:MAG: HAD family hydrolase [Christensenellaceae bacterium]|nr:HAD family hydrolase [Christensenellaceae bacterium]